MANRVSTVIRNFALRNTTKGVGIYLGVGDVELPSFSAITAELMGGGLPGKSDVVIPGHYASLSAKVNLHTPDREFFTFGALDGDLIEARGVIQGKDPASGKRSTSALRVVMRADGAKTFNPGKLTPGEKSEAAVEIVIDWIQYFLDGTRVKYFDFYSYIDENNGVDSLAGDRTILGFV